MRHLARQGPVTPVWLTRGGLGGDKREAESCRAMELLGIPRESIHCLRLPDGGALDHVEEIVRRLIPLMAREKPASVFVPAFEGGHPDHDAAQLAAAAAMRRSGLGGALYEFPLYHRQGARTIAIGRFIPDATPRQETRLKLKDRLMKRKLVSVYRSQRAILMPLLALRGGPMMVHLQGEPYRRVPSGRDYGVRPHPGRLAYEFYTRRRFAGFAAVAATVMRPSAVGK